MIFRFELTHRAANRLDQTIEYDKEEDYYFKYQHIWRDAPPYTEPDSTSLPYAKMFRAPDMCALTPNFHFIVLSKKREKEWIPAITGGGRGACVTQAMKDLIEEIDPIGYVFHPTAVFNKKGHKVNREEIYRVTFPRLVEIDDIGATFQEPPMAGDSKWIYDLKSRTMHRPRSREPHSISGDFMPSYREKEAIATIQATPELRAKLETFPFWCLRNSEAGAVYMNQETYDATQRAGLRGLEEYTRHYGSREQSVSHI